MQPAPTPAASAGPRPAWYVDHARAGDVRDIVRIYLGQSMEDRRYYHPFPFSRFRIVPELYALVAMRPFARLLAHRMPRATAMLFVGRVPGTGELAGFSTARFHRAPDGGLVVEMGYFVVDGYRRLGLGKRMKSHMMEVARRLGAKRAEALIFPSNVASIRLNESLGFRVHPSELRDRHPPYDRFLVAETDLTEPIAVPRPPRPEPKESAEPA